MTRTLLIALAALAGVTASAQAQDAGPAPVTRTINAWGQDFRVPVQGPGGLFAGAPQAEAVPTTGALSRPSRGYVRFAPAAATPAPAEPASVAPRGELRPGQWWSCPIC
ncbi:hypothetical protein [Methylobacterium sp. ID0610]|uniref:hypothetical protein n=1 Tax=Methylobacterium carpenticola TaxID=3344827 RepID=UPI00369825C8